MKWTILAVLLAGCGGSIEQPESTTPVLPIEEPAPSTETQKPKHVSVPERMEPLAKTTGLGAPCDPTVGPVNCGYPTAVCMGLDSPLLTTNWVGRCTVLCLDESFTADCAARGGKCVLPFTGSKFLMCASDQ